MALDVSAYYAPFSFVGGDIANGETVGENLLTNSSFEEWDQGQLSRWRTLIVGKGVVGQATATEDVYEGNSAVHFRAPSSGDRANLRQLDILIEGGQTLQTSFYYKKPETPAGLMALAKLTFRDGQGDFILPTTVFRLPANAVDQFTYFETIPRSKL